MSEIAEHARANHLVSTRVTPDLKASIERDSVRTGLSMADVVRLRLQLGAIPAFPNSNSLKEVS